MWLPCWLFGWGGGPEEVDAGAGLLDRWMMDPEGARELGWAGGWGSDAGAERAVRRRVVGSVGVVSGRGEGSEEVDTGVSLLNR